MTEKEGKLFMSETGRWRCVYADGDQDEWTSGERIELCIRGEWAPGRMEYCHGKHGGYYFLPAGAEVGFFPMAGTLARRPERKSRSA